MPGPDTAIVTRNALVGGRRAGLLTILGVAAGLAVWTLAAGAGIAAVIRASAPAFDALKFAGAIYLAWLGVQALWGAFRKQGPRDTPAVAGRSNPGLGRLSARRVDEPGQSEGRSLLHELPAAVHDGSNPSFGALVTLGLLFCASGSAG